MLQAIGPQQYQQFGILGCVADNIQLDYDAITRYQNFLGLQSNN